MSLHQAMQAIERTGLLAYRVPLHASFALGR